MRGERRSPPRGRYVQRIAWTDAEEETMTTNINGAVTDRGRFVPRVVGKSTNVYSPPRRTTRDTPESAREEATIDAEDVLLQANEALVMG